MTTGAVSKTARRQLSSKNAMNHPDNSALRLAVASHTPRFVEGEGRASVSLILRWRSGVSEEARDGTETTSGFLARHGAALELLFIQRSAREDDPWSGKRHSSACVFGAEA